MTDVDDVLVSFSCWLSMIGSMFVCLTALYPVENRKKIGKTLLFWLSISDFFSAFVYFMTTFDETNNSNSTFCKAVSLLGIFFPVSSFLWTDLIAFYLCAVIVTRNTTDSANWESRMKLFHFFVWGTSALVITIVAAAAKEGRDAGNSWCWIASSDSKSLQFVWELVGGKFIEWTSCLIILPIFYTYAALQLRKIEVTDVEATRGMTSPVSDLSSNSSPATVISSISSKSGGESPRDKSPVTTPRRQRLPPIVSPPRKSNKLFGKFYWKMAAVPLVFLLIRFWGSIRVILILANSPAASSEWLRYMIDIFDPSQGFFNSILFVVLSFDGQRSVLLALSMFIGMSFSCLPGATRISLYLEKLASKRSGTSNNSAGQAVPAGFSKYDANRGATDISNPIMSAYSGAASFKDTEDEIEEYSSTHSFGSSYNFRES